MNRLLREMLDALPLSHSLPLFTESSLSALRRTADAMAPVPRVGFEKHLGSDRVDHHQQFLAEDRQVLLEHARHMSDVSPASADAWNAIATFADLWLHDPRFLVLRDVWLEFDVACMGVPEAAMPSSFLGFGGTAAHGARADVVDVLFATLSQRPLPDAAATALDAIRAVGQLTHVGFMRGRADHGVRLVVRVPSAVTAEEYLGAAGWPGSFERVSPVLDELFAAAAECRIMIDVDEAVRPSLGIEGLIPFRQDTGADWERLTASLIGMGLCTEAEAAAMAGWPGVDSPGTAAAVWPASMILADLAMPDRLYVLCRRFSHVKVSVPRAGALSAKAYFGYGRLETGTAVDA